MCFKRRWLTIACLVFAQSLARSAYAEPVTLSSQSVKFTALPATCITLRQGRNCFANITLRLKLAQIGNYCVYQQHSNKPMRCWNNSYGESIKFEFQSNKKVVYSLKNESSQQVIALTAVEVSWVHKASSRKRRWRLF